MSDSLQPKPISQEGVAAALEKAEHYRLLNDPDAAESICLDILQIEPDNERARIALILALTDQFGSDRSPGASTIRKHVKQLSSEYQRRYYCGIVSEREARAFLGRGPARGFAYEGYREAMAWYEEAAELSPDGNDDAILRWNSCVRVIERENLQPRPPDKGELPLE